MRQHSRVLINGTNFVNGEEQEQFLGKKFVISIIARDIRDELVSIF